VTTFQRSFEPVNSRHFAPSLTQELWLEKCELAMHDFRRQTRVFNPNPPHVPGEETGGSMAP
jgi:hypothetical protein